MSEGGDFDGAKAGLLLGGRLLILRRDADPAIAHPDHWDLPGGGRERHETPWEALCREVTEETGLALDKANVLWRWRRAEAEGRPAVWFYVAALPEGAQQHIRLGTEGAAWALTDPERALTLEPWMPELPDRLRTYREMAGGWGNPVPPDLWSPL